MGFRVSKTSGFPGRRVEPYLAGITTTTLDKLSSSQLLLARNNSSPDAVYAEWENSRSAMLPHACRTAGLSTSNLFNIEHQAIALVFGKPGGKMTASPNRAAVPVGRDRGVP